MVFKPVYSSSGIERAVYSIVVTWIKGDSQLKVTKMEMFLLLWGWAWIISSTLMYKLCQTTSIIAISLFSGLILHGR